MTSVVGVKFNIPRDGEQDVRNFVRPAPLPFRSHVGVRMRARTAQLYDPAEPTREEVRRENYSRRYRQLSSQGFRTPAWKPYECIGDEVSLDERQLILSTLGQKEPERTPLQEADEAKAEDKAAKHVNPSLFIASRKNVKVDLKAELQKSESIRKHMNIGKSYFEYLHQEKEKRVAEKIRQDQLEKLRARTEARPPPETEESTDEEDKEDFAEANSVQITSGGGPAPAPKKDKSGRKDCRRKKRTQPPRPFTPLHLNIGENPDDPPWCTAHDDTEPELLESLFRQLCALHWLLEAMLLEDPLLMNPISSSWSLKNIGGTWVTARERELSTAVRKEWDSMVSGRGRHRIGGLAARRSTKIWSSMRSDMSSRSVRSRTSTLRTPSSSAMDGAGSSFGGAGSESRAASRASSLSMDESQVETRPPSPVSSAGEAGSNGPLTDNASDGAAKQAASRELGEDATSQRSGGAPSPAAASTRPPLAPGRPLSRKELAEAARQIGDSLDKEQSVYAEWKGFRATVRKGGTRPVSAPVSVNRSDFLSDKKSNMVEDMRVQLALRKEERVMELQDRLLHMQRHCERVSRQKFSAIPVGAAPHRAIAEMRLAAGYSDASAANQKRGRMRRVSVVAVWYDTLMKSVPDDAVESKKMRTIVDKLYLLATVASSRHTLLQFFRVLETLKDWEICAPHVCAAVEFVRTRVLDIGEEEFETWFSQSFPAVRRTPDVLGSYGNKVPQSPEAEGAAADGSRRTGEDAKAVPPSSALKKPTASVAVVAVGESPQAMSKTVMKKQRPLTAL